MTMENFKSLSRPRPGRPAGKPAPLTKKQQQGRNAAYERERRQSEVIEMAVLRVALNMPYSTSKEKVLVEAIGRIKAAGQRRPIAEEHEDTRRLQREVENMELLLLQRGVPID